MRVRVLVLPAFALSLILLAASAASAAVSDPEVRPGPGVTSIRSLSCYLPALTNTPGDTPVYVLEGKEPGGTGFVAIDIEKT